MWGPPCSPEDLQSQTQGGAIWSSRRRLPWWNIWNSSTGQSGCLSRASLRTRSMPDCFAQSAPGAASNKQNSGIQFPFFSGKCRIGCKFSPWSKNFMPKEESKPTTTTKSTFRKERFHVFESTISIWRLDWSNDSRRRITGQFSLPFAVESGR